jgi:magnesium transporter
MMSLYVDREETRGLISSGNWDRLAEELAERPVVDVADVLVQLDDDQRRLVSQRLSHGSNEPDISSPQKGARPYLENPYTFSVKRRVGWLIVLLIGQMGTATVIDHFDNALEKALVLALFIPMIISSGGNSGSQAATLIIRAMALGEVRLRDWLRVMYRESIIGVVIGVILGLVAFLRILIVNDSYGEFWLHIGITIALSTFAVVLTGSVLGSILPLLLKALRTDPATSSAPFVATLADISGLIIYFLIATWMLGGKLL